MTKFILLVAAGLLWIPDLWRPLVRIAYIAIKERKDLGGYIVLVVYILVMGIYAMAMDYHYRYRTGPR
jgi:hypothetical protein